MRDGGRSKHGIAARTMSAARGDCGAAGAGARQAGAFEFNMDGQAGPGPAAQRPARAGLSRLAGVGVLGIWLAALSAGSMAFAEDAATPVTGNAGMGTAETVSPATTAARSATVPEPAAAVLPVEMHQAPAEIVAPAATVATRGGIDGAGDTPAAHAPAATQAATESGSVAPAQANHGVATMRGGTDAAGDGEAASPTQVATVSPASAPADVSRPETPEIVPPIDAAPADISPADAAPATAPAVAAEPPTGPLAPVAIEIGTLLAPPAEAVDPAAAAKPVAKKANPEEEALAAFYGARQNLPVFVSETGYSARGAAVLRRLGKAGEDGLDAETYAVATPATPVTPISQAKAELDLARAALAYARDAQAGRFNPIRISELVTPTREIPAPLAVLEALAAAPDADAALEAYNPPHPGYKALKAKLAETAGQTTPVIVAIPAGPLLKPGATDARVPALRTRLGLTGAADDHSYDPALVAAVKAFQEASGSTPDGVIGSGTLASLNREAGQGGGTLTADIIANMERWRWLPRDLGEKRVMVNIPEYLVRIFDGPSEVYETRVVVGKPETPTPLLSHEMEYVVVNPAWNIPPSIAKKEMMPLLRSNPGALARQGIEAKRNRDGSYSFRQPPGERNALGRIKFMFPNDHAVYLHDTPSRSLFANARRAYSHGCMRVQDPLKFGEVVFQMGLPDDGWTEKRIGKLLGGSERYINLKDRLPVHVTYFTTVVDEQGKVRVLEDIYGINARVKALLGLSGQRRVAEGTSTRKR